MAAHKLRVLSNFMFQSQIQIADLSNLNFSNSNQDKWLESFPTETAFPDDLFFIPKGDVSEATVKIEALRIEARLAGTVNPQLARITPNVSCEPVGQADTILMNTTL